MSTLDRLYCSLSQRLVAVLTLSIIFGCQLPEVSEEDDVGAPALPSDVSMPASDGTFTGHREDGGIAVLPDIAMMKFDQSMRHVDADSVDAPCEESDQDGDGFGTHESCNRIDCDDTNPSIHPDSSEACNGNDDDCDERIDEEMPVITCGIGACERMSPMCVDGEVSPCRPGAPDQEVCNGLDDDCDDQVDEFVSLTTCGVGQCANTASCLDGSLTACEPLQGESETCDGLDNDCDGEVDEGFGARIIQVAYTELASIIDGCSGEGWAGVENADCDAAMHRYCSNEGCYRSGFGPAEHSNGFGYVTCLSNVEVIQTTFAMLSSFHSVCASDGERRGENCNAAISRFCRDQGYVSGYGPIENFGDQADVACVRAPAHHHGTTYSVLTTFHVPCDGSRDRSGPNCNAAIKRYCVSLGYASGFGPNENSGDNAVVTCIP